MQMVFSSNASLVKDMVRRVLATKKVRLPESEGTNKEVEDVIESILTVIDHINSRPEHLAIMMDRDIDDFLVINEFKDFIMPDSVRQDVTDVRTANVLRETVSTPLPDGMSYNEWLNLQSRFRSWFKKDMQSEVTNLGQLRVKKSLVDVLPCCRIESIDGRLDEVYDVRAWDEPFIPIDLNPGVRVLLRSDWFNTSSDFVISDYISEWLI